MRIVLCQKPGTGIFVVFIALSNPFGVMIHVSFSLPHSSHLSLPAGTGCRMREPRLDVAFVVARAVLSHTGTA